MHVLVLEQILEWCGTDTFANNFVESLYFIRVKSYCMCSVLDIIYTKNRGVQCVI